MIKIPEFEPAWMGPGSLTCDVVGPPWDCRKCWGTGGCRYGKTEEEWDALCEARHEAA